VGNISINNKVLDKYFDLLSRLDNNAKKKLIIKLTESLELYEKFREVGTENCAISEITLAELIFGAENSKNPKKNYRLIEDLTD